MEMLSARSHGIFAALARLSREKFASRAHVVITSHCFRTGIKQSASAVQDHGDDAVRLRGMEDMLPSPVFCAESLQVALTSSSRHIAFAQASSNPRLQSKIMEMMQQGGMGGMS